MTTTKNPDDETRSKLGLVPVLFGAAVALVILTSIKIWQIGPRVFWATDACADPAVMCGNFPLGTSVAALAGVLTTAGLTVLFDRYTNVYET